MAIRKMSLEEKHDKLLNDYLENAITNYVLLRELGALDKGTDLSVKVQAKMLPSLVGIAYKVIKAVAPGAAFNRLIDEYIYNMQRFTSPSNIELNKVSDREVTVRVKDCPILERVETLVKKTGLDMEPKSYCEFEQKINRGIGKEFGIDITTKLEEKGCMSTATLK